MGRYKRIFDTATDGAHRPDGSTALLPLAGGTPCAVTTAAAARVQALRFGADPVLEVGGAAFATVVGLAGISALRLRRDPVRED